MLRFCLQSLCGLSEVCDLKGYIHSGITRYVWDGDVFNIARRDTTMDKIVDLINEARISSEELIQLENKIRGFVPPPDEPW